MNLSKEMSDITKKAADFIKTIPVMNDIVKIYNPANTAGLTSDQLINLQKLTSAQIKELAQAYPNLTMQRAYLLIVDSTKPIEKQLPNLSSFENLYNLREKNGQRKWVAYGFKGAKQPRIDRNTKIITRQKVQVVDLSDTELLSLPGFKTKDIEITATEVPVKKIRKTITSNPNLQTNPQNNV